MDVSNVVYPAGSVLSVEKVSNILLPSLANGFDERGDHTVQALTYLIERFGSVTSFTGTFKADRFVVNISRTSQYPGKTMHLQEYTIAVSVCNCLHAFLSFM